MPSPILARADALMQRRRSSSLDSDDVPVLTDSIEEDEFPILIDIDRSSETFAAQATPEPMVEIAGKCAASPLPDTGMRDILVHELARRQQLQRRIVMGRQHRQRSLR